MISLPIECYYIIFNNFQHNYKNLFSCALVNRQWCKFIIPILWSEPGYNFGDTRLIRTCLLTLNAEEQASLIPFDISLPSHQKPLFEYTSFITSVSGYLSKGIKNWFSNQNLFSYNNWFPYDDWFSYGNLFSYNLSNRELEHAVKCSLITMLLRTCKNLKYLYLDEIICNPIMLEYFYKNTTITSVDFHLSYDINDDFKSKAIDGLEEEKR
ncbi:f-box domain-containing protein [Gigaspora margarita]|uniref:F-box domain-containing protein n=1 Tax=Gigaspora margarita TaxID=4874 RepID=A0A8H4EQ48_GIGMA|nr:f-box domain-containing protein [Gigaspora margarita]